MRQGILNPAPDLFWALKQPGFETPRPLWGESWKPRFFERFSGGVQKFFGDSPDNFPEVFGHLGFSFQGKCNEEDGFARKANNHMLSLQGKLR